MLKIDALLKQALATVLENVDKPQLSVIVDETNIFENVDSFMVVDLMLETEMLLETETGRYITLADEKMFDAGESPLLRWSNWVDYVEGLCANDQ
jgi:hypothetical protein